MKKRLLMKRFEQEAAHTYDRSKYKPRALTQAQLAKGLMICLMKM